MANKRLATGLLLSLLGVFALSGIAFGAEGESIGAVSSFYGDVKTQHQGEAGWNPAELGMDIFQFDTVKTEIKSKVRITFEDGSLLNLSEDTEMVIKEHIYAPEEDRRASLFSMLKGKVRVLCQRYAGRDSRFHVETPTAVIGIRGTEFIIWVVSNELTTVICLEDEVFVRNVDEKVPGEVMLKPNEMTKVGLGVPPLEPSIAPEELRHQLDIDTAAYKITPGSARPEAAEAEPAAAEAVEEAVRAAAVAPPMPPRAAEVIAAEEQRAPELPPIPQDPAESEEFKPPVLDEPPPPPGQFPHPH